MKSPEAVRLAEPVLSKNSITAKAPDFQSVETAVWDRFLIVPNGRDQADGVVSGGLDQPAAGGRDRLPSVTEGEVNCRERLGGLLRYYYRDAA